MQGISSEITQIYPRAFSKNIGQRFNTASKDQMNQFWTIMKGWGKKKKKFKQYSGLTPESFSNHQYDPLLNSVFSEGLDEDLAT